MEGAVRLLMVEDAAADAELELRELKRAGLRLKRRLVQTEQEYVAAIERFRPEIILSDFSLPGFDGMRALSIARERCPEVPFIFVSGTIGEEYAIRALRNGATDYVLKGNLKRLPVAVERALTDARQAAARRESDRDLRRFRAAMDISIDSIYLTDPETMRFVYVNDTACKRLGYERKELMGKRSYEVQGKQRADLEGEYRAVAEAGERGTSVESRYVRSDGTEGWTELHRRAMVIDGSTLIVTLGRDITDRKRAELALREAEQRFRSIVEDSAEGIYEISARGAITTANPAAARMLGYDSPEELIRSVTNVGKQLYVDQADLTRLLGRLNAEGTVHGFETRFRRRDGTEVWALCSVRQMRNEAGKVTHLLGALQDITERKQAADALRESEERFRSLTQLSSDWFWQTDAEHRFIDTPDRVTRLTGMGSNAYVGKRRWEVAGLGPVNGDWSAHQAVLARRESYRDLQLVQVKADGTKAYLQVSGEPVYDSAGRFLGYRGTAKDISAQKRDEEELRRFRLAMDGSADIILLIDRTTMKHVDCNDTACRLLGYTREELLNMGPADTLPVSRQELERTYDELIRSQAPTAGMNSYYRCKDGSHLPFESTRRLLRSGDSWLIVAISRDIRERLAQQTKIERLLRVRALMSGIGAAIMRIRDRAELFREACRVALREGGFRMAWAGIVDRAAGRVQPIAWEGVDEDYIRAMPLHLDEATDGRPSLAGRAVRDRKPMVSDDLARDPRVVLREEAGRRGLHSLAILPLVGEGEVAGVLALYASDEHFFDAEEMKLLNDLAGDLSFALEVIAKEEKINYLALHDPLTGLANRALLVERLGQTLHDAGPLGAKFPLVSFDLERLTSVNESLGRQAGDTLIRQVGERLARAAGPAAVARIAADHFVVMMGPVKGRSEASRIVADLARKCFAEAFMLEDTEVKVAAKAGIALFPNDGLDAETLLGNGEAALRKAKETGERQVFYTPGLTERTGVSLTLETKLRRALEKEEFVLHYQPKVEVETRRIAGVEALIRWQSPELGLVPPGKFIPLMEETGMILDVGTWALKRASLDHRNWTGMSLKPPRVAVNVSAIQLRQKDFVSSVEQAIMEGIAPTGIDLEITESLVMEDIEGNIDKLRAVRALGVGLAVDDFGTGYSSLSYLAKLPVQTLKIDRSFVITMLNEPDTMTLVQTIISLAHSLRLKVVAEGVDAEDQAKVLRLLRCDQMQGYLFSKPVPFDELTTLLRQGP